MSSVNQFLVLVFRMRTMQKNLYAARLNRLSKRKIDDCYDRSTALEKQVDEALAQLNVELNPERVNGSLF